MELVIGIVAFSVVLTIVTGILVPQATRSVDPIMNVRAAELAQSMLNEITAKSFDEQSDRSGGVIRCNEDLDADSLFTNTALGERACSGTLGPDASETDREDFDDVDDYHGYSIVADSFGNSIVENGRDLYAGFSVAVAVIYDDDKNGIADAGIGNLKLITVNVSTPLGNNFTYSVYRSNF